jgi:hypothetical protein
MLPRSTISQAAAEAADKIIKFHGAESTPKALAKIVQNAINQSVKNVNKFFLCQFESVTDFGWHATYKRVEYHAFLCVAPDKKEAGKFCVEKFPKTTAGEWEINEITLDKVGAIHLTSSVNNCGDKKI